MVCDVENRQLQQLAGPPPLVGDTKEGAILSIGEVVQMQWSQRREALKLQPEATRISKHAQSTFLIFDFLDFHDFLDCSPNNACV